MKIPHPREPLRKGLDEAAVEVFCSINKLKEKIIYFYCLSINYNNRSPDISNDSQNSIERTTLIHVKNNVVARLYF